MDIRELSSNEMDLIQQVQWIYEQSFPVEERDPFENMLQAIRRREQAGPQECENCHFQVAVEEGQATGMAFFNYYPKTRMGFIPYLAVHPSWRNGGLGTRLYHHLVECVAAEAQASGSAPAVGVVFEVEVPELGKDVDEQALRRRRMGFYQRNGALVVPNLALIAPPLGNGLPEMPYEIMLHPLEGAHLPLGRSVIEAVVETVLGFSYGLPPSSPYYRRTLESIQMSS
jgi:GNAT superfamily N-acetyltransferase